MVHGTVITTLPMQINLLGWDQGRWKMYWTFSITWTLQFLMGKLSNCFVPRWRMRDKILPNNFSVYVPGYTIGVKKCRLPTKWWTLWRLWWPHFSRNDDFCCLVFRKRHYGWSWSASPPVWSAFSQINRIFTCYFHLWKHLLLTVSDSTPSHEEQILMLTMIHFSNIVTTVA